jgi:hypothetical protein
MPKGEKTVDEPKGVTSDNKPKGSGLFAFGFGSISLVLAVLIHAGAINPQSLCKNSIIVGWFFFSGGLGVYWGISRMRDFKGWKLVGQDTMTFILAMVGITAALLQLLAPEGTCQ